jgi:hypothetical protein
MINVEAGGMFFAGPLFFQAGRNSDVDQLAGEAEPDRENSRFASDEAIWLPWRATVDAHP